MLNILICCFKTPPKFKKKACAYGYWNKNIVSSIQPLQNQPVIQSTVSQPTNLESFWSGQSYQPELNLDVSGTTSEFERYGK